MTDEVSELHNIAVSIMKDSKINVIIDNELPTAMTDFKNIYVTIKLIPKELHRFKRVVSRIFDGEVSHEAAHIVITAPIKQQLKNWMETQSNRQLANIVHQAIEDKRVNHFILQRYRFDFAHRLQLLADVSNRLWIDSLKLRLAEMRNSTPANTMKPEETFVDEILLSIATLNGLWGWNVENDFHMREDQKEFVYKSAAIFNEAQYDRMSSSIVNRHQQLYNLWTEKVEKQQTGKSPENYFPGSLGGNLILESGIETKKALAKMEKELKQAEEKAEAEAEKTGGKTKASDNKIAIGSGSGLNIPTPTPNQNEYEKLAQRNREHIERLLNLLKKLSKPKLITNKWRKQGRFMTEILAKAYATSTRREIQDTYSSRTMQLEKTEACIGLIVDLSGSVSEEDAKDSLTVISEVCGRWLRDEDFAIIVFGCVPPDTEVCSPSMVNLATARYYKGKLIEITTKSKKLRLTPNHPVLTKDGWKMAKDITQNDEVFVIEGKNAYGVDTSGHNISERQLLQTTSSNNCERIEADTNGSVPLRTETVETNETNGSMDRGRSGLPYEKLCYNEQQTSPTKTQATQIIYNNGESEEFRTGEDWTLYTKLQKWKNQRIQFLRARNCVLGRDNRRGRESLHIHTTKEQNGICSNHPSDSDFKYVYFANEVAPRKDQSKTSGRQEARNAIQKTVLLPYERVVPSTIATETRTILDNQKRALSSADRIYTKPIREMCFPTIESRGTQHYIENPRVKQERTLTIQEIPYEGLVYNLETESDTYWANGILVHNSEYQKIKAYVEPYHTTRTRIGGVTCLGGTELHAPLNELYQMMKAQRNSRSKILIIVSDFYVDHADKCKKLIKTIERDNINVIGLGIDGTKIEYVKEFCQKAKYIGNITELPEAVFDLYREVAF